MVMTWKENRVYTLDRETLVEKEERPMFAGAEEGWGITADETAGNGSSYLMYVSDGTSNIQVVDGNTMETVKTIAVTDSSGNAKTMINELEYVAGYIYANIWFEDIIVKIDPENGNIVDTYDFSGLKRAENNFQNQYKFRNDADVLNGIAYDPSEDCFYLSGKNWHLMFKVTLN